MVELEQIKQAVNVVVKEIRQRPIPFGVSNRHVHLSEKDYRVLFPNQPLTIQKPLRQPGQFAAEQTVTLVGPKGILKKVRILGPLREESQIELSRTDARALGIPAPLCLSGKLAGTPGIKLISSYGELIIDHGVMVAWRHVHMSPFDALIYGVKHGDKVQVAIHSKSRKTVFDDVSVRVSPDMVLELHVDTDEANAAGADEPAAYAVLQGD